MKTTASYLLLHGYGETPEVWNKITEVLKDGELIPVDLMILFHQSTGEATFAKLAERILTSLTGKAADRFTIIANSMGGYLAMELLEQHCELFNRVILISTHPFADNPDKIIRRQREAELIRKGKAKTLFQASSQAYTEPIRRSLEVMWQTWSEAALINALDAMQTRESRVETLANSTIPVRFIIGDNDVNIDASRLQATFVNNPNIVTTTIAGQDHWMLHHWHPNFATRLAKSIID